MSWIKNPCFLWFTLTNVIHFSKRQFHSYTFALQPHKFYKNKDIFRYNSISGGKYRLYNAGSPVDVTSDIANGAWHHILLTYDSSTTTVTVYTDNVQTFTSSSRNYGTGNNIGRIGSGSDGSSYYTGDMSNISIWDGVVTTSQRNELYNNGTPKDLTNN